MPFIITDGDGMKIEIDAAGKKITIDNGRGSVATLEEDIVTVHNKKITLRLKDGKLSVKNGSKDLFTVLDTHLRNVIAHKTAGSPALHAVHPGDIQLIFFWPTMTSCSRRTAI